MTPLLLTVALLGSAQNQAAPDTTRYIILKAGNPAGSELADHLPRGGLLEPLGTQLRAQLGAGEVPPREQRDGRRARSLGICALLCIGRFG